MTHLNSWIPQNPTSPPIFSEFSTCAVDRGTVTRSRSTHPRLVNSKEVTPATNVSRR